MNMGFYVGAYATSANVSGWNAELETNYYSQLKAMDNIKGLEHPFVGSLHAHDDDWFLANISPNWQFVFTCIPGIMGALGSNPQFGIASDDEQGRQAALTFMKKACDAVAKLNAHAQRQVVKAVQIQTAPNRSKASGSAEALQASLNTMLEWDWQGAKLIIEHCDALVEGQTPSKGFLTLNDEIAVVKKINETAQTTPLGILVNWGRSVIETRTVDGAIAHIKTLKAHNILSGLMFSGVSDQDTDYGKWQDSHMPPAPNSQIKFGAEKSLLTQQEMLRSLQASGLDPMQEESIVGIKIGIRPRETNVDDRVSYIADALRAIS